MAKSKQDYAEERAARKAALDMELFMRRKPDNSGFYSKREMEQVQRSSVKIEPPKVEVEKSGVKVHPPEEIPKFKPFSFALDRHEGGALIYYGQLIVAINQTSLNSVSIPTEIPEVPIVYVPSVQLTIEQQEIPNPVVYVPVNLETSELWKPTKLDWFGDVFLEWGCDENAVMDPAKVKISGPETPSALPIPAYSNGTPPPETDCLYFIKIGSVPEDGKIVQNWASDVYWQPHLIRGGGTGL